MYNFDLNFSIKLVTICLTNYVISKVLLLKNLPILLYIQTEYFEGSHWLKFQKSDQILVKGSYKWWE
jgi:hypothetical protein